MEKEKEMETGTHTRHECTRSDTLTCSKGLQALEKSGAGASSLGRGGMARWAGGLIPKGLARQGGPRSPEPRPEGRRVLPEAPGAPPGLSCPACTVGWGPVGWGQVIPLTLHHLETLKSCSVHRPI